MADECTCECVHPGNHETPPEWEQDPDCPVHPMTKAEEAPRHTVGITEIPLNLLTPWLRVAGLIYPDSTVTTPQGVGLAMQLSLGACDYEMLERLEDVLSDLEDHG